jgi:cytosine/adenosine deaminase-related metal-dependent hydrolase
MLEVAKLANILPCVATPEYRDWPTAHYTAMRLGAANGYKGILLEGKPGQLGKGGVLEEGALADVSLWDLTSLSMLPRTDPLSLLIQGSRTQAPGAGSALDSAWVNGTRVVKNGSPVNVDVIALREVLRHAQGEYRDPAITDPSTHDKTARAEKEYRAAMDLDPAGAVGDRPHYEWPEHCTLYEASQR